MLFPRAPIFLNSPGVNPEKITVPGIAARIPLPTGAATSVPLWGLGAPPPTGGTREGENGDETLDTHPKRPIPLLELPNALAGLVLPAPKIEVELITFKIFPSL